MCREWAKSRGYCPRPKRHCHDCNSPHGGRHCPRVYTDVGSAKNICRPGIQRLLSERLEIGDVVAYRLDRLTRSIHDWCHLLDHLHGTRAGRRPTIYTAQVSVDLDTAAGRYIASTLILFGEFERHTISQRTTEALAKRSGRSSYEMVLPLIEQLRAAGKSLRDIAAACSMAMGKEVGHSTVRYLIKKHLES